MRVLVACEFSGVVRDAFIRHGHDATSCDLLPSERPGPHYQGDVRDLPTEPEHVCMTFHGRQIEGIPFHVVPQRWDLMIAHPPCTDLAVSGARWFKEKQTDGRQQRALDFVLWLMNAPIERIAIENPVSIISSHIRVPDQIIQPWMFGHGETKATCLWLKNLPPLVPTDIVAGREQRVHLMPPGPERWRERSRTYEGIAEAMASQWGTP